MKRILSIILVAVMVLSCSASALAAEGNLTVDEKLILMGFPASMVAEMPELMKEDMASHYEEGAYYGGSSVPVAHALTDDGSLARQITSAHLELWITYLVLPSDSDGTAHRKVYAHYNWLQEVYLDCPDIFGILWGNGWCLSDDFDPVLTCQRKGRDSGEVFTEFFDLTSDNSTSVPNQGITYNGLVLGATANNGAEQATDHSGWLTIQLERSGGAVNTNVVASYTKARIQIDIETLDILPGEEGVIIIPVPTLAYFNEFQSAANYVMS